MKYYKLVPNNNPTDHYYIIEVKEKTDNVKLFSNRCINYFVSSEETFKSKDWDFTKKYYEIEELLDFKDKFEFLWLLSK